MPSCLLDRKWLVCDFSSAVVNESQLQTAECWRADFIFDPSDLHKLLVLGNTQQSFYLIYISKISTSIVQIVIFIFSVFHYLSHDFVDYIELLIDSVVFFLTILLPATPFSSRAVCLSWWGTVHSGSLPQRRPHVPAESRSPDKHRAIQRLVTIRCHDILDDNCDAKRSKICQKYLG